MKYPDVVGEVETLETMLEGYSIARFGDQELLLMLGANTISQTRHPRMVQELRAIISDSHGRCLTGVPTYDERNPFTKGWNSLKDDFAAVMRSSKRYYSAFVSRPDQAPWTNTPQYFDHVEDLWRGKDVTLVANGVRSLTPALLTAAKSVYFVQCDYRDAYKDIDSLERQCLQSPNEVVLMCAGPTATCLANRIAEHGRQGLDLGHIGRFWRRHDEIANWRNEREIDKTTGLVKENPF